MSKRGKKMTMAGAIEGRSEAKVNISQQKLSKVSKSCLRCYILQIQKRSPFPAEVMKTTYLNQRFSKSRWDWKLVTASIIIATT
jgi:hypothetical protein